MNIGEKIKELRLSYGLTQEELATRCELTKGFISQVERDLTSPSIATLVDILQALGVSLKDFFSEDIEEDIVFTKKDYFENISNDGIINWLVPNAQKNYMEPVHTKLNANSKTIVQPPSESEFFGYVLKGRLKLNLGEKQYIVKKGETFYYTATREHFIESLAGCEFIWISSPPIF